MLSRKDSFGRIICGGWGHVAFEWSFMVLMSPIMIFALFMWPPSRRNGDMSYRW